MRAADARPTLRIVIGRALRERCPRCGVGAVFAKGFEGHERCQNCNWRLERSDGHWVGGTEINLIACFSLGFVLAGAGWLATGNVVLGWALGASATVACAPALYRRSRCLFFALDYLIDPTPDESWGDDGRGGDDREPDAGDPPPRPAMRLPLDSGPPAHVEEALTPLDVPDPAVPDVPNAPTN